MKMCKRCSIEKDYDRFSITKASKDGLNSWCKDCKSEYSKSMRECRVVKDIGTKLCTNCEIVKDVVFFSTGNNKDGLNNWCKDCNDEYGRTYYKENKERLKPIRKIWKANNSQKLKDYQKNRYISTDKERLSSYYIKNKEEIGNSKREYRKTDEYKNWIKIYRVKK